jgi:hypothetical protein
VALDGDTFEPATTAERNAARSKALEGAGLVPVTASVLLFWALGDVGARDLDAVEEGDEAVVVAHVQRHAPMTAAGLATSKRVRT